MAHLALARSGPVAANRESGTAYHTSCHTWFTLSHGILNEIYYPNVDCPNTRDLQFLITDGETFCHEEKRDLDHKLEYPEQGALYYRLTNCDRQERYLLIKEIITDPHASVVLIHARLEIHDKKLLEKLLVYALLAPHLKRHGYGNTAWVEDVNTHRFFHIERSGIYATFGCSPDFTRRSVGYVGATDGWRDLKDNFRMDYEFDRAENGNIAVMGEVDLTRGAEFTIGLAFGRTPHSAAAKLCQSLSLPFKIQRKVYVKQWHCRQMPDERLNEHTGDCGRLLHLSECILLAHEDKIFQGAFVASMSIPWGEMKGDDDLGGYHLVWPRDMVQTSSALLALVTGKLPSAHSSGSPASNNLMAICPRTAGLAELRTVAGNNLTKSPPRFCLPGEPKRPGSWRRSIRGD